MIKKLLFLGFIITFICCTPVLIKAYMDSRSPQSKLEQHILTKEEELYKAQKKLVALLEKDNETIKALMKFSGLDTRDFEFEERFSGKLIQVKKNVDYIGGIQPFILHPEYIKNRIETYSEDHALTEEEENEMQKEYLTAFKKTSIYISIYGVPAGAYDISNISGMIKPEMWSFYFFDETAKRYTVKKINEILSLGSYDGIKPYIIPSYTKARAIRTWPSGGLRKDDVLENHIIIQFDYDLPSEPTNLKFMATGSVARFEYSFNWEEEQEN